MPATERTSLGFGDNENTFCGLIISISEVDRGTFVDSHKTVKRLKTEKTNEIAVPFCQVGPDIPVLRPEVPVG